jgi:RND superfamily putative drug exporter
VRPASNALESDPSVADKEGWATNAAIAARYGADAGGSSPLLPIVTLPSGETVRSPGVRAGLKRLDARLQKALPVAPIASYASTGDETFLSHDGRTIFALVYPRPDTKSQFGENPTAEKAASRALQGAEVGGRPVRLTGFDALAAAAGGDSGGPGLLLEAVIGGVGALLVLAFVFASLLALVPIVMAVVSIMTTFLLLLGPADQRLADRRVPGRPDRAWCGDRLLAAHGVAVARGALPRS